jgi:hypothetical protein
MSKNKNKSFRKNVAKTKKPAEHKFKPVVNKPKTVNNKSKTTVKKQEDYPHFRYYRKSGHPALIVGDQISEKKKEEYRFRKVMHDKKDGRHLNEEIFPNPDLTDPRPMNITRRVRHDEKVFFSDRLPWKYPDKKDDGNKDKKRSNTPRAKINPPIH